MRYLRVDSEGSLIEHLREGGTIIAGGTDLLVKMRGGGIAPQALIDVSDLETMRGIEIDAGSVSIGAAVTHAELIGSKIIRDKLPLLAEVLKAIGSPQIRNRGTIGGNLVNASPAADSAIPLLLYDASLIVVGSGGERTVPLDRFFRGPGRTALEKGEFVRRIRIPLPPEGFRRSFHKVGKRKALTIAIASLGSLIRIEDGSIAQARFAAGSVAPTPIRLHPLEEILTGRKPSEELIEQARGIATGSVSPIDDIRASAAYRRQVIGDLAVRAIRDAAGV